MNRPATTPEFGGGRATIPPAAPPTTEPEAPLISSYIFVEENGTVVAYTGKAEVGQNIRTSLAQAVADELRLPFSAVRLVMADTTHVPFDRGTFGSRSTPDMAVQLRRAAASAREMLTHLASERWESDRSALAVRDGQVIHLETGQALSFAELTGGQPLRYPVLQDVPLTPASEWIVAGTSAPKVDALAMVTGSHRFASDVTRPGMMHGKVLRAPSFGATLVALDSQAAEGTPGVAVVREGGFVGVVAPTAEAAMRGLASLRAEWTEVSQPSEAELSTLLKTEPGETEGGRQLADRSRIQVGSIEEGLAAADHVLQETYTNAYIAHAPLEPRAAVAEWSDSGNGERLTVWTGTQRPFGVHAELVAAFGLPEEHVRVVVPDTGSGYGGKHTGEAAIEAARLSRAIRKPVKVVWSREEEFTWAYLRPAGVMELRAGVRTNGTLTAWEHHNFNAGASALRTPYQVPHQDCAFHHARSPLRQGSYRALAATANTFARESAMDELAHAIQMDPLSFRLQNLSDDRMRAVLETAAAHFGWASRKSEAGIGAGLACGTEKAGYVATCAEVSVPQDARELRILRVVVAFECGAIVNPDHLRNQVEGAVVQGIGGALFEAIHFENGRVLNPRFSEYRVPRFRDVPPIDVVLLDRKDVPSAGAGEAPIIAIAPALANAIFAATGTRRRSLPLATA
ncbi:MAG TPA: molybdopterin cofactor-binding domain-containing protein [Chloroflexota bacterium]|nr:molybdopterin cofactor-binding domain-containing protein [Chloroflexota bacterium]